MRLLEQPHRPPCPGRGDRRPEAGGLEWRGRVDRRGEDQATVFPAGRGHPRLCLWAAGDVREPMRPAWREQDVAGGFCARQAGLQCGDGLQVLSGALIAHVQLRTCNAMRDPDYYSVYFILTFISVALLVSS